MPVGPVRAARGHSPVVFRNSASTGGVNGLSKDGDDMGKWVAKLESGPVAAVPREPMAPGAALWDIRCGASSDALPADFIGFAIKR